MTLLDKPFGYPRTPDQITRNRHALKLALAGDLKRGDLARIVLGRPPMTIDTLFMRVKDRPGAMPERTYVMQGYCRDCSKLLDWDGAPLASQPQRCSPCGRARRKKHNDAAKTRSH